MNNLTCFHNRFITLRSDLHFQHTLSSTLSPPPPLLLTHSPLLPALPPNIPTHCALTAWHLAQKSPKDHPNHASPPNAHCVHKTHAFHATASPHLLAASCPTRRGPTPAAGPTSLLVTVCSAFLAFLPFPPHTELPTWRPAASPTKALVRTS